MKGKNKSKKRYCFKFKNAKKITYEVYFRKPNERWHGEADGTCADPKTDNPKIFISPYLTPKTELNTIVHEFTHAFFWNRTEKEVYKFANTVAGFLYRQGWRRDDTKRNETPQKPRKKKRHGRKKKKTNRKFKK